MPVSLPSPLGGESSNRERFCQERVSSSIWKSRRKPVSICDYLVSDTEDRSGGRISFPSEYTNTGAYFRTRVYGGRAGQFFDVENAFLWMPAGLVETESIQLSYLAARAGDTLCIAFSNQSDEAVDTWIQVNPELAEMPGAREAKVWIGSKASEPISLVDGRAQVRVSPKGLVSLAIPEVSVRPRVQHAMLDPEAPRLAAARSETFETHLGALRVTPLTYGKGLTMLHVLIASEPEAVDQVTLRHAAAGEEVTLRSDGYPHEFTVAVPDTSREFTFEVEGVREDGMHVTSGDRPVRLQ